MHFYKQGNPLVQLFLLTIFVAIGFSEHATKKHVIKVGEQYVKYTSKLKHVVVLNFTMGFHHRDGKPVITESLNRIASKENFTIEHIVGGEDGSEKFVIPDFNLSKLSSGQVIVANNISGFGNKNLGRERQEALENAIAGMGIGYLGFHTNGDNTSKN